MTVLARQPNAATGRQEERIAVSVGVLQCPACCGEMPGIESGRFFRDGMEYSRLCSHCGAGLAVRVELAEARFVVRLRGEVKPCG